MAVEEGEVEEVGLSLFDGLEHGLRLLESGESIGLGLEVGATLVSPLAVRLEGSVDAEGVIPGNGVQNLLDPGAVAVTSGEDAAMGDPVARDGGDGDVAHMCVMIWSGKGKSRGFAESQFQRRTNLTAATLGVSRIVTQDSILRHLLHEGEVVIGAIRPTKFLGSLEGILDLEEDFVGRVGEFLAHMLT
jgi:hypothetical protein